MPRIKENRERLQILLLPNVALDLKALAKKHGSLGKAIEHMQALHIGMLPSSDREQLYADANKIARKQRRDSRFTKTK